MFGSSKISSLSESSSIDGSSAYSSSGSGSSYFYSSSYDSSDSSAYSSSLDSSGDCDCVGDPFFDYGNTEYLGRGWRSDETLDGDATPIGLDNWWLCPPNAYSQTGFVVFITCKVSSITFRIEADKDRFADLGEVRFFVNSVLVHTITIALLADPQVFNHTLDLEGCENTIVIAGIMENTSGPPATNTRISLEVTNVM